MKIATILKIDSIEGSEFYRLNEKYPKATGIDGINKIFCDTLPDAIDPIVVSDMGLTGDALLFAVANILFDDDRSRSIHIEYSVYDLLFKHPTYQLYAGNFDTLEGLNKSYNLVFSKDIDAYELESAKVKAREDIKSYFTQ